MLRVLRSAALFLAAAGLLNCGGPTPPGPELEQSLTRPAGCGDVLMYTSNADDTTAVIFNVSGKVEATRTAGTPMSFPLTFPSAALSLRLYQGKLLTYNSCTDVFDSEHRTVISVDRSVASGSGTLTITPGVSSGPEKATLVLTNIVFEDSTGAAPPVTLPHLEVKDVAVGWFPG